MLLELDAQSFRHRKTGSELANAPVVLSSTAEDGEIEDVRLHQPIVPKGTIGTKSLRILPTECRQRGATYKGRLVGHIVCSVGDKPYKPLEKEFGEIPIMVKSDRCHLANLSPKELIAKSEHEDEWGGYFIVKGHERLIRMLLMTRRNYPIAVNRPTWKNRGKYFSDLGVIVRCVAEDETSTNNVLHYITDGSAKLMFSFKRNLYFAPIIMILKSLLDVSDEFIFKQLTSGFEENLYFKGCVIDMLHTLHEEGFHTQADVKAHIGEKFRVKLFDMPEWASDIEICDHIIKQCLAIHLESNVDKFNLFVLMTQKLFTLAVNECCVEGMDSVMCQEILLGGHLYLQAVKEKLHSWLTILRALILKKANNNPEYKLTVGELELMTKRSGSIENSMENFLATGNIYSQSGLGLMQDKGLTIVVENINRMRYMSHFRAVHRGAFFQEMRTTEVRQLLPDAWGFICPVHTPDGAPCGLLNHLSKTCHVTGASDAKLVSNIPAVLIALGMSPLNANVIRSHTVGECYIVMLDGRVLGHVVKGEAPDLVKKLRFLKIQGKKLPHTLELAFIPQSSKGGQFPGLFLFTGPARMMRPVVNLAAQAVELIGTLEQVHMDICIVPEEAYEQTTHQEISSTSFLSNLACLIPLPDCNQSPRNMYQCQMGKQTMGTPCHTWNLQSETKMYRLQTPASPFFRPAHYDKVNLDDFAMGTNAIVAVISYTGYDMEDAMIINKASFERGFAHGSVYKSEIIDLKLNSYFAIDPKVCNLESRLDLDGLPHVGAILNQGDPFYSQTRVGRKKVGECVPATLVAVERKHMFRQRESRWNGRMATGALVTDGFEDMDCGAVQAVERLGGAACASAEERDKGPTQQFYNADETKFVISKWKGKETVYVDSVKLCGSVVAGVPKRAIIQLRVTRNPSVGDKFASRAGQKGICSQMWPLEDLPYSETGLFPDIIFNPHAMIIEVMAGKSAAVHGLVHDATPFKFSEKDTAAEYFGKMLEAGGYNYYGTEKMYSGIQGCEMEAAIFFGVVHYQRLRHMVSDKWQVRSTGPIDVLTHQPVKGRRRGGGVRFGEMERDALLAHGAAFLLQDRLFHCSDKSTALICRSCGNLLSPLQLPSKQDKTQPGLCVCRLCEDKGEVVEIEIPYIFRYLVAQFASVNIKLQLDVDVR
uniref:DNA-directed RNA polymerase subunit beta n=1 Tax=Timema genevievae TaxID=629358 RepID=A0A7R9JZI7_TIMGE|nr:unnamed protein product [Timema genevievae]